MAKAFEIERLPTGELHRPNTASKGERYRVEGCADGYRLFHRCDSFPDWLDFGRPYSFEGAIQTMAEGMRENGDTLAACTEAAARFLAQSEAR